ncbi:hypothetical protein NW760_015227 [Fusarium oxysporum]|nr:hypothetical protein NW769_015127 [Fusarium oxysporum]KAJ4213083.1 hypothetical protein NW760_015227 [Fusarium oxysporum]
MDPFAALGAAAAIAQFVQMGVSLVSKAYDTYSSASGMPGEDEQLGFVIRELSKASESVVSKKPIWQQTDAEKALAVVAEKCQQFANSILRILERTKADDPHSKRQSAVAALKSMWNDKEKKALKKDADDCRNLLHLQLTSVMGSETIERLKGLAKTGKASEEDLSSLRKQVATLQRGVHVSSLGQEAKETLTSLVRLSNKALDSITSHRILNSLTFPEKHSRYTKVPNAYSETFGWIFEENVTGKQQQALEGRMLFREWLETGDGVFHISGKPGAGKSTLMRFLFRSERTKDLLAAWSAGRKLILSKFFFWKHGSDMENSVNAMLRTLIYDTLEQCPELTSSVFPQHWSRVHSLPWQAPVELRFDDDEIREAFSRLIQNRNSGEKRCLFFLIDGLDEFQETPEERYKDLVRFLSNSAMAAAQDMKLCVSSREYDVFLENFKGPKSFELQKLTYDDIYNFVHDKLQRNQNFLELAKPPDGTERLISKVTNRADGVFLWVSLVVNLLDDACDGGANFSELEDKIEWTPREVEDLFRQLFDSIHESDRDQSAQTFAIALKLLQNEHGMRMSLFRYSLLDDFNTNPEFASSIDHLKEAGLVGTDQEDIERRLKRARKQLYRRCKGLLEIHTDAEDPLKSIVDQHKTGVSRNGSHLAMAISLAHRDIYEFLLRENIEEERTARTQGFDMFGAICQTFAAEVASMMCLQDEPSETWGHRWNFSVYLPELVDILRGIPQYGSVDQHLKALDNLDVLCSPSRPGPEYQPLLSMPDSSDRMAVPKYGYDGFSVCHFAALLGIEQYFRYETQLAGRDAATKDGSLVLVLTWTSLTWTYSGFRMKDKLSSAATYPVILRQIFQHGCCPNQAVAAGDVKTSLWTSFASLSVRSDKVLQPDAPGAEMAQVFLDFGADPNISFTISADKWNYYLHVRSPPPTRPTNIRVQGLPSARVGPRDETCDFVSRKGSATLRDTFEFLSPPNLQTLLALMDQRQDNEKKKHEASTLLNVSSPPNAGTETPATRPLESHTDNRYNMNMNMKGGLEKQLGAKDSNLMSALCWMSGRDIISKTIIMFGLGKQYLVYLLN